nr:chymotrypsinogen B isoform X1 [Danio rerio]XP_021326331.1 chymotrypsinogen B isoform X1 [Danio rerio]|eukprot:XP_017209773.1 chymotrypsinogen B isoform X1 [Danio rerio]
MYLQFNTDSTISARGFSASLSFISEKDLRETVYEDQGEEADDDSRVISPHLQAALCGMPDVTDASGLDGLKSAEDDGKVPWLWHVSISLDSGHHCNGVIIQAQWILTNAHCVNDLDERLLRILSVTAHGLNKQTREVFRVFVNPQFNSSSLDYNVALLQLSSPLNLSGRTQPACLPSAGQEIPPSLQCWTPVWTGQMSGHEQWLKISVMERAVCEQHQRTRLTPTLLCAGLSSGDSGVPYWNSGSLYCLTNTSGVVLMGLKSWGETYGGTQKPAVYSSVPATMHWISQMLNTE